MAQESQSHPDGGKVATLSASANLAMGRGEVLTARGHLEQAVKLAPNRHDLWINLAACCRRLGDYAAAFDAVNRALSLAPRSFLALLMNASLLERAGEERPAAIAYGVALTQAPPSLDGLNAATLLAVTHAREVYGRYSDQLQSHLVQAVNTAQHGCEPSERRRLDQFVEGLVGRRKRYRQEPAAFFYPGLPAIEFYDPEQFSWLQDLEASTDLITAELEEILAQDQAGFVPYVDYADTLPLDQWRPLNRSPAWSAFHILADGARVAGNAERCSQTLQVLARMPQPDLPGHSPSAMFSVLKPGAHIPPHTGVSNTRLVVHLPLIVPRHCRFRVGNETRTWTKGEAWVFDDTIEHEAFNDSEETRIILIFDVWQPAITPAERLAIKSLTLAMGEFGGAPAPSGL